LAYDLKNHEIFGTKDAKFYERTFPTKKYLNIILMTKFKFLQQIPNDVLCPLYDSVLETNNSQVVPKEPPSSSTYQHDAEPVSISDDARSKT
jgi:hypothetical protein